ncbi:MAG: ribbon-helix-helix protein, CopG family [Actinomycetota bacterium]
MIRTTIMADEGTIKKLRMLAKERGVSFAEIVREALRHKAEELRPKLTFLGSVSGTRSDTLEKFGSGRVPPRS